MNLSANDPARLGITGRIEQLHESYRLAFQTGFDPGTFRADDFYAFQVLEKALGADSPELRRAAQALHDLRLAMLEEAGAVTGNGADSGEMYGAERDLDDDPTVNLAMEPPDSPLLVGFAVPGAALATPAPADVTIDISVDALTGEASEVTTEAPADAPAGSERRAVAARGHVRLGYKEIVLLSQMRIQYRKVFGSFFEIFDFTGNDLYARSLLALCLESGNPELAGLARQFVDAQGRPRLHRRVGSPDLELN
jgi:hypothetical protein